MSRKMYGLKPADIEAIQHLRGAVVTQICLGPHDIQFNFTPQGNISIQSRCELSDSASQVVDVWERSTRSGMFRFPDLLMKSVVEISIESQRSLLLKFENGMVLRVVDDFEQYESYSVGNLFV